MKQGAIFGEASRLNMHDTIELFLSNMVAHASDHRVWVEAWSGGKDSTAAMTMLMWALCAEQLASGGGTKLPERFAPYIRHMPCPERLIVLYADTTVYSDGSVQPLLFSAETLLGS